MARHFQFHAAAIAAATVCTAVHAQVVPPGFAVQTLAAGLVSPTCAAVAPDGRVFIALQTGELRVWHPNTGLLPTPFFTFDVDSEGERGLIGVALDPNFSANGLVYAHISRGSGHAGPDVVRIAASLSDPDVAEAATLSTIFAMSIYFISADRVGGAVHFGPDGKLYVGIGDNDVPDNAQSFSSTYGKLLRINSDGTIPTDNPYYNTTTGNRRAIWALGLRNPFTFAFQPGTGRLFVNDVGENTWEEINDVTPGANLGWPATEGDFDPVQFPQFTRPFYAYNHTSGPVTGSAITGSVFYNPTVHAFPPDYTGDYFFGDSVSGWVKRIDLATHEVTDFASNATGIVDLDLDSSGGLLMLMRGPSDGTGSLIRVAPSSCSADFNHDGVVNSSDFFDFLIPFFENSPEADFNNDGTVTSQDFFDFLSAFFAGC